ncbi:AAA family ATPase, partial [Candidatus Aerophobetes bacterium]|nr:AAA family ATPase [Candidatus Aerophobetes bacterium]
MKKLFVAATRQDDGKSTLSLGLLQILKKSFSRLGFMKPVGQRYIIREGCKIDEDVALVRDICQMKESLVDMNPVVVVKGFTEEYILKGKKEVYIKKIKAAFER